MRQIAKIFKKTVLIAHIPAKAALLNKYLSEEEMKWSFRCDIKM